MTTKRNLYCGLVLLITLYQFAEPVQGNWFRDLLDPHISYWNPVSSGSDSFVVENLGFGDLSGMIVAFGDFNADEYTDVFTVRREHVQDTLQVYVWSNGGSAGDQFQYLDSPKVVMEEIDNVIPSDFNYDGRLDVLVQGKFRGQLATTIFYGDGKYLYGNYSLPDVPSSKHVMLLDANMDMRVDLFGELNGTTQRVFWISQEDGSFLTQPLVPDGTTLNLDPIAEPHSNAFIDLNGDCLSDLVVISQSPQTGLKSVEIWLNSPVDRTFSLDRTLGLPSGAGQVSFGDLNHDGTMDLVFPVCDPPSDCSITNAIYVAFNSQLPMCSSITGSGDDCTESDEICQNTEFSFPLLNGTTPLNDGLVIVPSSQFHDQVLYFTYPQNSSVPHTISVGDYNCDGFPDLLVALRKIQTDPNAPVETNVQLWDSVTCSEQGGCSGGDQMSRWRSFSFAGTSSSAVSNVSNAFAGCFFDIGEDGTLDVIVFSDDAVAGGDSDRQITCVENAIDHGNYFLKSLALNGQCFQWCGGGASFPDPKPVGVNFPGVAFKYIWTDNDQDKRVAMGVQMFQTAYLALQTPYVYLGVGDVSSYFQEIYVGLPSPHEETYYKAWADVLPNSQVVIIPNPPDSPYFWKMEVFLRPSGMTFWTLVGCVIACAVLAGTAVVFKLRERKQDGKDQSTSIIL